MVNVQMPVPGAAQDGRAGRLKDAAPNVDSSSHEWAVQRAGPTFGGWVEACFSKDEGANECFC